MASALKVFCSLKTSCSLTNPSSVSYRITRLFQPTCLKHKVTLCTINILSTSQSQIPDEVSEGVSEHRGVRVDADAEGRRLEVVLPPRLHERQVEGVCHLVSKLNLTTESRKQEFSPTGHGWRRLAKRGQRCRPPRLLSARIVFCLPADNVNEINWALLLAEKLGAQWMDSIGYPPATSHVSEKILLIWWWWCLPWSCHHEGMLPPLHSLEICLASSWCQSTREGFKKHCHRQNVTSYHLVQVDHRKCLSPVQVDHF